MMAPPKGLVDGIEQVCVVVNDLDKTIDEYVERAGIGPWAVYTYDQPDLHNTRVRGREVAYGMRLALAWTGSFMWEVIEPIHGPSIYREFLDMHGEGMHHVLVRHNCDSMADAIAEFTRRGCPPAMEGSYKGTDFAYVETDAPLKMILELVQRPIHAGYRRPDPERWYPHVPQVPFT
jgi:methylmalonyl-CoA/ethylmalonyl-CoA epimerase